MREKLAVGGYSAKSWSEERFTALLFNAHTEVIKGEPAGILTFLLPDGTEIQRWATTLWHNALEAKIVKLGDVLEVVAKPETNSRGGRFRPFDLWRVTGKAVPKAFKGITVTAKPALPALKVRKSKKSKKSRR